MGRAARWGVLLVLCLASCNGCEEEETPPTTTTAPSGERHLVGGIPVGTVEGVVRLADGDDPPSYADSPFDGPTAGQLPTECSPPHGSDRHPLAMDDARGLASVGVVATGDSEHWIAPGEPVVHEVHIRDCRLDPITVSATRGDSLHVVNEHSYPFMPELGLGMLQAVLPTDPLDAPLDRIGARQIQCAFAAPCGRMQVMVFGTPVHTVSTEGGHFRIDNVPADQDVTITAWHPTIEPGTATTRVAEGGTVQVEITVHRFTPPTPEPPIVLPPGQEIDPGSPREPAIPPSMVPGTTTSSPPTSGPALPGATS
jgi:hypothetical protein